MTEAMLDTAPVETRRQLQLPLIGVVWVAVAVAFIALRIAPIWHTPVAGAELIHLSGAWQARIGVGDDRFVPTLFQALSALLLHWSSSDIPARLLAFAATATIPGALYLLRGRLGEAGALLALILLALDGPGITVGASASAMGFDLAIALWLFTLTTRQSIPGWLAAVAGFAVATAGPITLPLVAGWAIVHLLRHNYPRPTMAAWCAGGVVVGVLLATFRFGLGPDGGLRVPPFQLFADSYSQLWSTAIGADVTLLYALPVLVAGLAAVVVALSRMYRDRSAQTDGLVLIVWAGAAAVWWVSSLNSHTTIPVVALTTPLAVILGPALVEATTSMWRADWHYARWLIPGGLLLLAVALEVAIDWAQRSSVGPTDEKLAVAGLCVVAVAAFAIVASARESFPALFAAVLAIAAFPMLSGAFGVALSTNGEPIPSPQSSTQARELRGIALEAVHDHGGLIVVSADFKDEVTWPFRDSGSIVVASRVPPNATFVVWPKDAPAPEGFAPVNGDWSLQREMHAPTSDFLTYLRWFSNRNVLN
ncbi:MAG: hypothetical protein ABI305_01790, partial [Tepidiformaceae bacterium]